MTTDVKRYGEWAQDIERGMAAYAQWCDPRPTAWHLIHHAWMQGAFAESPHTDPRKANVYGQREYRLAFYAGFDIARRIAAAIAERDAALKMRDAEIDINDQLSQARVDVESERDAARQQLTEHAERIENQRAEINSLIERERVAEQRLRSQEQLHREALDSYDRLTKSMAIADSERDAALAEVERLMASRDGHAAETTEMISVCNTLRAKHAEAVALLRRWQWMTEHLTSLVEHDYPRLAEPFRYERR